MKAFIPTLTPASGSRRPSLPLPSLSILKPLAACALALLFLPSLGAPGATAQAVTVEPKQQQDTQKRDSPFDDESESGDDDADEVTRPRVSDPATVLRTARVIRVHSKSAFVNEQEVEDSLRKRKEFRAWGMVITRNDSEADLIIEVTRKALTRRFTFSVLDPKTMSVVASGKTRSVLFGKKIPNKIAEKFANRVKVFRPYPPAP